MEIIDNRGAPPELIRLANAAASKCKKVKKVIFGAFIEELNGDLGAYDPAEETIVIDMGACIKKQAWMKKGILFIPNVWFNLVFTFFHEMAHAFQLEEDPDLIKLDVLPEAYEHEANIVAEDSLLEWAKHGSIPRLNELGWVGDEIKNLLNILYSTKPDIVNEEMEVEGTEAAADALHASLSIELGDSTEDRDKLLKSIDEGLIGLKIRGKRYLTAYEAINTTHESH